MGTSNFLASEVTLKSMVPLERIGQILQNLPICDGKSPLPPALLSSCSFPFRVGWRKGWVRMYLFLCVRLCMSVFPSHLNGPYGKHWGLDEEGKGFCVMKHFLVNSVYVQLPATWSNFKRHIFDFVRNFVDRRAVLQFNKYCRFNPNKTCLKGTYTLP